MAENNQTNAAIDNRKIEAKLDHMKKQMDNFTQLGKIFQWNFLLCLKWFNITDRKQENSVPIPGLSREVRVITYRSTETFAKAERTKARVEETVRLLEEEQVPRMEELRRLSDEEVRKANVSGDTNSPSGCRKSS